MENGIVIIGAGAAGLAAAQRLKAAGLEPLVIEARNRPGGRIWTDHSYGPVELGAEFIHGQKAATWQIIEPAGLTAEAWPRPLEPHSGPQRRFARSGKFFSDEMSQQVMQLVERIEHYNGPEQSVAETVSGWDDVDETLLPFALDRLACLEAADVSRLSAKSLANERELYSAGWDNFHICAGYDALIKRLAEGVNMRLNTAVARINWADAATHLWLQNGQTVTARCVIITIPLSLLQAGYPHFEPGLPAAKQQAIQALAMGQVSKLVLWFKEVVWPPFQFLGTDGMVITWWPVGSLDQPALMGYSGGPKALELAALGPEGAVEQGVQEVVRLFGEKAREMFMSGKLVDWSSDPWSRGAYSYTPVGAGQARAELAKAVGDSLFFAGEATLTNGHQATVHGAIESGWRAAAEVLQRLG